MKEFVHFYLLVLPFLILFHLKISTLAVLLLHKKKIIRKKKTKFQIANQIISPFGYYFEIFASLFVVLFCIVIPSMFLISEDVNIWFLVCCIVFLILIPFLVIWRNPEQIAYLKDEPMLDFIVIYKSKILNVYLSPRVLLAMWFLGLIILYLVMHL